jgi:hypothetical protein
MREGNNFGQTIWDKSVVLLGISLGNTLKTCESTMGTRLKHTQKKKCPTSLPSKEKRGAFLSACSTI